MILNSSERSSVEQHIADLERFTRLDQMIELRGRTLTNPEAHAVMIATLLLKGMPKLDQESSDALTDDYLDAIEDLPAWSIREALRKWNRGESRLLHAKPHNYDFRPSPPTLRRLSMLEVAVVRDRITKLHKLSNAQPLIEYSLEHRQDMLRRLAAVVSGLPSQLP